MANFLAIATVTEGLRLELQDALVAVPGAVARNVRPESAALPDTGVTVFLYQVTQNVAWRNEDLATRNGAGELTRRPREALDLHYLLTCHGKDDTQEPEQIIGLVREQLHSRPVLTADTIARAKAGSAYLAASNLEQDPESVRFTPDTLNVDELSKIWTMFQAPYLLCTLYRAGPVLIESDVSPTPQQIVETRNVRAITGFPIITGVASRRVGLGPTSLVISGENLQPDTCLVRIASEPPTPATPGSDPGSINVDLPAQLPLGATSVQIVETVDFGTATAPLPHDVNASNRAMFARPPEITADPQLVAGAPPTATIQVRPDVLPAQNAHLFLRDVNAAPPTAAAAYRLPAQPLADASDTLTFDVSAVNAGTYLVCVMIDATESVYIVDAQQHVTGPELTVP